MKNKGEDIKNVRETLWINSHKPALPLTKKELDEYLAEFEELSALFGVELPRSPLTAVPTFRKACTSVFAGGLPGKLYVKQDNALPISASVKFRGALYEVLHYARGVSGGDTARLSGKVVSVASTGNLGLSVGLLARSIGFSARVYLSKEATAWKVEMLRSVGAEVVLADGDYTDAVALCRRESEERGYYFVDDERSELLYRGYACAAYEVASDEAVRGTDAPVFVYLPCGVGNAPSGIAAGLKALLGDRVHIFLAEPVEVPSVLLGLSSGKNSGVSVYDFGKSGRTVADGLACGRMAERTAPILAGTVSGIYTVEDDKMLGYLKLLGECEKIRIEPSAAAGLPGMGNIYYTGEGMRYLADRALLASMDDSIHIAWLTGGGLLPDAEYGELYRRGEACEKALCDFLQS